MRFFRGPRNTAVPHRRIRSAAGQAAKSIFESLEGRTMMSTVPVASGVPLLSSNPTATAKIYLDFDGDTATTFRSFAVPTTAAYDTDGDATTFSDTEQANIREIWSRVSEKFSPFNVDVTTVRPGSFADKAALQVVIGGDGSWLPNSYAGIATTGAFTDPGIKNSAYVFTKNLNGVAKWTAETAAHQIGVSLGLNYQSVYNSSGVQVNSYNPGNNLGTAPTAPIMGQSKSAVRGLWWYGTSSAKISQFEPQMQDDMTVLAGSANGFGYRADDFGGSIATATALSGSTPKAGIIERVGDVDYFSFTTAGGQVSINANGAQYGQMLDVKLQVFNSAGQQVALGDTTALNESLTTTLSAGTYYVAISGHGMVSVYDTTYAVDAGDYADVGQYTLSVTGSTAVATAPKAPSLLDASTSSTSQINLTWTDNSDNETNFVIDRSTSSTFTSVVTASVNAGVTSYSATGLVAGTTYFFRVRATNAAGNSANSATASATTQAAPTAPAAASGLAATAASTSQVSLAWNDNSNNETGFEIDRATNSTFTAGLASMTVGANATSYSMAGLAAGTTYYFRVRATNGVGDSANTSAVYATTMTAPVVPTTPSAASGVTATAASSSQINLAWVDNSTNETGFKIQRSTNSSFTAGLTTVTVGANVRNYSATGLAAGTTYYFRVIATNTAGDATASNTASAVTNTVVAPTITTPAAPTGLKKNRTGKKVTLSWLDRSNNETGFRLQYSLDGGATWRTLTTLNANQTSYQTTMKNADTFRYRVQAYNTAGNSGWNTL